MKKKTEKTIKDFTKEELLARIEDCYTAFIETGEICWKGEIVDNDDRFKQIIKEGIVTASTAKVTMREANARMKQVKAQFNNDLLDNYRKAKVQIADLTHLTLKLEKQLENLEAKYEQLKTSSKDRAYKITDEDKDLLIEIENVLCTRSRQIWGLTHKKKIKGGADITPYETGYDKLFEYMELVAKIIG